MFYETGSSNCPFISVHDHSCPGHETCEPINVHLYGGRILMPKPLRRHPRDFAGPTSQQNSTLGITRGRYYRTKPEGASATHGFQQYVAGPVAVAIDSITAMRTFEFLSGTKVRVDDPAVSARLRSVFLGADNYSTP